MEINLDRRVDLPGQPFVLRAILTEEETDHVAEGIRDMGGFMRSLAEHLARAFRLPLPASSFRED